MSQLRFGAMVLGYNQEEYIAYCLRALSPEVDRVIVMHSALPWNTSNPHAREEFTRVDRTGEILDDLRSRMTNLAIVTGVWDSAPQMRQAGLEALQAVGMDVVLIVDADEFYPDGMLARVRGFVSAADQAGAVYYSRYRNCYKQFDYQIESDHRMAIAVHLASTTRYDAKPRTPTGIRRDLPDDVYFWHMGYVLSDRRMREKLGTFSHAHEVLPGWYERHWLNWTPQATNFFRKHPASRWRRTIRIDPTTLPTVLHDHPFFPHDR